MLTIAANTMRALTFCQNASENFNVLIVLDLTATLEGGTSLWSSKEVASLQVYPALRTTTDFQISKEL